MNTTVEFDAYVFDVLMRDLVGHDRRPAAFLIYVSLASGAQRRKRSWSHLELAEHTGLSKRTIQEGLRHLARRRLIQIHRRAPTEPATIDVLIPWPRGSA